MFQDFCKGNKKAIHPNIRGSVYGIVLQEGGKTEVSPSPQPSHHSPSLAGPSPSPAILNHPQYDAILNEYRTARNADERNTALRSLGRASDPELIQRTLALPLSDDVKGQDLYLPIAALRTHAAGIDALWKWMKGNWTVLEKKLPPGLTMLSTVVQICTASFTTQAQLTDVEDFFRDRSTKVCSFSAPSFNLRRVMRDVTWRDVAWLSPA